MKVISKLYNQFHSKLFHSLSKAEILGLARGSDIYICVCVCVCGQTCMFWVYLLQGFQNGGCHYCTLKIGRVKLESGAMLQSFSLVWVSKKSSTVWVTGASLPRPVSYPQGGSRSIPAFQNPLNLELSWITWAIFKVQKWHTPKLN
jgi:hypothetical protein